MTTSANVYVRISQDRAGERAGVIRQREDCMRRAADRGWEVLAVHEDNDQSAKSGRRRPGFEAVLDDVQSGRVGVVIAWALDRLQRNRRDELRLYEACQAAGVTLSLVNGAELDFSTAAGRYVADNLGSIARLEVELKSDRQQSANKQAAHEGRRSGGRRPFGYDQDGMTIREREADAIRTAYRDLLSGVPLAQIAKTWNEVELHSGQARWAEGHKGEPSRWTGQTVRVVLSNPRYAGLRAYKGEIVAEAKWPPVVAQETWRAAVAHLSTRQAVPRKLARRLLSGLALCGVCGAPVWGGGNARQNVPNYRCSAAYGHFARMSEPVDEYVSAVILERLSRPDAAQLLTTTKRPDTAALHDEASTLRNRLESVALEFADGTLTASQIRAITERLRSRLAELEESLADAGRVDVLGPLVRATDVRAVWDGLSLEHRRAIIDTLATVTIHPPGRGVRTFDPATVRVRPKGEK
ncbi:recombinase family protein [Humibacillus xanthopallidus]|uniref:DNA invertase Pin-like site-specific DNA recombinase n=1 Tax=Humibacillus xanthopallidus TaxID=412689 RepID=A0A543HWG1_9MICO|nr:recombinase family protein [Humibacillus xanthopallidus]TQM62579.1 DNA invertase Pin-like site-specific DNA recombinase [Humibacillus xanthopallidus]